jgi:hypothetical protein
MRICENENPGGKHRANANESSPWKHQRAKICERQWDSIAPVNEPQLHAGLLPNRWAPSSRQHVSAILIANGSADFLQKLSFDGRALP